MTRHSRASLALALGGALWGLYWIPLRWLAETEAAGLWPGLVMISGSGLVALLLALARGGISVGVLVAGMVMGSAFGLFTAALLLTDVARAILLFYLTPIWGTLLGRFVLAEAISRARLLALVSALLGLAVIFGLGGETAVPMGLGDAVALASGVIWAFGSLLLFRLPRSDVIGQSAAFLTGATAVSLAFLALSGVAPAPSPATLALTFPAALYVLPMVLLTVWPSSVLTPARVGLILMTEVVVGLTSAALFAGEPFGPREALGAALIVLAALIEVVGHRDKADTG